MSRRLGRGCVLAGRSGRTGENSSCLYVSTLSRGLEVEVIIDAWTLVRVQSCVSDSGHSVYLAIRSYGTIRFSASIEVRCP